VNIDKNPNCKYLAISITVSLTILLMIMAGPASFVSSNYHAVFAAKNATKTTSPSSSSKGGSSVNNSTSPIGSSSFLKVVTKVDNTKGGRKKPSDFTITVSGKSPSPKSFSGSTSGTSVTLKAGKYKVTGAGPSGYNIAYSSGCSGTASGGVPINCIISPAFSTSTLIGGSNSTSTTTKLALGDLQVAIYDKANCKVIQCPPSDSMYINVFKGDKLVAQLHGPTCAFTPGCGERHDIEAPGYWPDGTPYKIQAGVDPLKINPIGPPIWSFEEANIFPQGNSNCTGKNSCQGTVLPFIHGTNIVEINYHFACVWYRDC
jgi:hypothetical protein